MAKAKVPVVVAAGTESRGNYTYEASKWVAARFGTALRELPGAHAPYFSHPHEMVDALRPLLRSLSTPATAKA